MTDDRMIQSNIVIKNVAVCMYGQYRTGDACKEYIKKFYDMPGVNVDFFCSLKEYETSYTRPHYNKKSGVKDFRQQQHLSSDAVQYQSKQIHDAYNPVEFKIYTTEYEEQLLDIDRSLIGSKVLAGWADSIMLKQKHEAANHITYDLVVMQRYDVLVWPTHAFRTVVNELTNAPVDTRMSFNTADKNLILLQPIELIRRYNNTFMYPNGQDMFLFGVGTALDNLVYDAMEHIPGKHRSNYSTQKLNTGYPVIDTHEMIASIAKKMNIPTSMFPYIVRDREDIGRKALHCNPHDFRLTAIAPFPIRAEYWEDNVIPDLANMTDAELELQYDTIIGPNWHGGK